MLRQRSQQKELIDLGANYYTSTEYVHCLKILFRINQLLGIFYRTRKLLKKFSNTTSLLDVGCGGGLFVHQLSRYFPEMQLTGVDISPEAIHLAQQQLQIHPKNNVSFTLQSKTEFNQLANSYDIITATFLCHHLSNEELIVFLQHALKNSRQAVILNDLHRHPLAYWFYKYVSPIFRNRLITHDGLISICRGFTRKEWQTLLLNAGISDYKITWCFPFWWRVILWKKS